MKQPVHLLKEFDYVLLHYVGTSRGNKQTIAELGYEVSLVYKKLFDKPPPTYSYIYQRVVRLHELGFLDKQGKKTFRVRITDLEGNRNQKVFDELMQYVEAHMRLRFGENNGLVGGCDQGSRKSRI